MKLLNLFRRKKPSAPAGGEEFFKKKYQSFKNLLEANNAALEVMSHMEATLEGDYVFDPQFIRASTESILEKVQTIVQELNTLGDNCYAELVKVYQNIAAKIQNETAAAPSGVPISRVLPLSQVDRRLLLQVGGKIANLGEIKNRLQLPTPEGFVLTNEAYRLVLAENRLTEPLASFLKDLDINNMEQLTEKSRILREMLLQAKIPSSLVEEVNQQYDHLITALAYKPYLALRSSGLYEDLESSFAGQFLTVLNVPFDRFFPSYLEVLASQFTPTALVYLSQKRLLQRQLAMSVGCLAMVPARSSGVIFTAEPTGGRDDVLVIDAAWGLGPAVVDGSLTPDHFVLSKKPALDLLEQQISRKTKRWIAADKGIKEEAVPLEEDSQPALTSEELLTLGRYALQLEEYFGSPQDIEFSVDQQGQILLLQSRPLTLLTPHATGVLPPHLEERHPVLLDHGTVACFGVAAGPVFLVDHEADLSRFPDGAILVARHTTARYGAVLHKAAGMVIDIGSATSHLAILAREFKIPALVDTGKATQVLRPGQEITVDANQIKVYEGRLEEILQAPVAKTSLLAETPIYARLRRVLRWITPLRLTDPQLANFTPAACQTLHDITRFAHQMAVTEMFELGEQARQGEVHMVQLQTNIPLNLYIIDLGGGIRTDHRGRFVSPEDITSIPLRALWRGISHPEISWAGPIPIDVRGLYSVVSRSLTAAAPQHADFWARTLAIVSENYLNYSSRLGYHFATIDALVSDVRNDNYLNFRFKGGAADESRRGRRARFLGEVLTRLDLEVEITGDLVVARLWKYPRPLLEEKLDLLGRLMGCARQRDMVMADETTVEWYIQAFLEGNYRFAGEPGSVTPPDQD